MKNFYQFKFALILAYLAITACTEAATIYSTTVGGLWDDVSTWQGGVIPGTNDTAIVQGPVTVGYVENYNTFNSFAGWVIVEPQGTLKPHEYGGGLGTFVLFVEHDIVNNGTITNPCNPDFYEYLKLSIKGDIINNAYWGPQKTELTGTDQHLTLGDGATFGGFWESHVQTTITAKSDLHFDCRYYTYFWETGDFNLNGSTLFMDNYSLNATGTLIYNGTIEGDFEILGVFDVNKNVTDTLIFKGNITVTDTLQGNDYGGGLGVQKLHVEGNLLNNGCIRDREDNRNGDLLSVLITGDIVNNGIWTCSYVSFVGEQLQQIEQSQGVLFNSDFSDLNDAYHVEAMSDIEIQGDYNLNNSLLEMNDHRLKISGWLHNGSVQNIILENGFLQNLTSNDNLTIEGKVSCDNGNIFENIVVVADTLQSNEYGGGSKYFDLYINGEIINNGVIQNYNDGDKLRVILNGDIINNGIWMNAETQFEGTAGQQIEQGEGAYFTGSLINQDSANKLNAISDFTIKGNLELNRSTLEMNGNNLCVKEWLTNGYLNNAHLHDALIKDIAGEGFLSINGRVTCDLNNSFSGKVTVFDTLDCNVYGGGSRTYVFSIDGDLINLGVIKNNDYGEKLQINVTGNITNDGVWTNYLTNVFLTENQYIELIDDKPIEGTVYFDAVIEGDNYQWYFNDAVLDSEDFDGETSRVLRWLVPVGPEWYGNFTCETGSRETVGLMIKKGYTRVDDQKIINYTSWVNNNCLFVRIPNNEKLSATVYDINGRQLIQRIFGMGEHAISIEIPGYYILKLQSGEELSTEKFVVY